ncbi:hypothetical protein NKH77_08900 [Streptomyces sp. M19]
MVQPHCSKCCPVKPPPPPERWVWPFGVYFWLITGCLALVGAWWLVLWILHSLLG